MLLLQRGSVGRRHNTLLLSQLSAIPILLHWNVILWRRNVVLPTRVRVAATTAAAAALQQATVTTAPLSFSARPSIHSKSTSNCMIMSTASSSTATSISSQTPSFTITNRPPIHAPAELLPPWLPPERTRLLTRFGNGDGEILNPSSTLSLPNASSSNASNSSSNSSSSVVYWMQRDVRVDDNWALAWAAHVACERNVPLKVVYVLPPPPPLPVGENVEHANTNTNNTFPPDLMHLPMTRRHGHFMLGGLECVHTALQEVGVPLHVLLPPSHARVGETVMSFLTSSLSGPSSLSSSLASASSAAPVVVIADFSPLRMFRDWMEGQLAPLLDTHNNKIMNSTNNSSHQSILPNPIPLWQVDAHNIVPVWTIPGRQVGARTLRPKIHKVLNVYLRADTANDDHHFPSRDHPLSDQNQTAKSKKSTVLLPAFDRDVYEQFLQMDESVPVVDWAVPGTVAGLEQLEKFIHTGLPKYDALRNDPNHHHICSDLSPWLNHGHVSFHRVARRIQALNQHATGSASFLEEGIVRRELSDNFVYFTPNQYDRLSAAAGWAQETLQVHARDVREYVYENLVDDWECAGTHDDLWNAAQLQLVREGRMHGFMRMYWAKKILEWSVSPAVALATAQYLNDKYALDGRDPNGFVGVGWSIMGIHDQGWGERPVFGKIRYMNYAGCKRKFNVASFVAKYAGAAENAAAASLRIHGANHKNSAEKEKAKGKGKVAAAAVSSSSSSSKRQRQTSLERFATSSSTKTTKTTLKKIVRSSKKAS